MRKLDLHIQGWLAGLLIEGADFNDVRQRFYQVPSLQVFLKAAVLYRLVRVPPAELNISAFPPVLRDWVIKGRGMSSLVYATGHIKDPVPLIAKRRGLAPGGRFPPSFIHQVIIITGLNKLYNCMFSP